MELMLVVGLMGLMVLLVAPNFQQMLKSALDHESDRLAGVIRMLRSEAILQGIRFRLMLDLNESLYLVEQDDGTGEFAQRSEPAVLRPHTFPESFSLTDIKVMGETIRPGRDAKPVPVFIDSSGYIDPFLLHFAYGGQEYTFRVAGFTGRIKLMEGYAEE